MTEHTESGFQIDLEEGYSITFHSLSRHKTLSLESIALLVYLFSHNQDKYQIKMKTVLAHFQGRCGHRKIYALVNELIEEGYIQRTFVKLGNLKSTALYKVAGTPKFKKSFRRCGFGHVGGGDAENCHAKEEQESSIDKSIEDKEEQCKERSPAAPASADAEALATLLLEKKKEHLPDFKQPNMKKWTQEIDKILRIDKRSVEQVKAVICFLEEDEWFKSKVLSPEALRRQFDNICAKMQMVKTKSLIRKNREFALQMKNRFPDQLKALSFDDKYVMNRSKGKELPFKLPHETFQKEFVSLFGGKIIGGSHD